MTNKLNVHVAQTDKHPLPNSDASELTSDDLDAAIDLPNVDRRQSVLEDLPKDLFVEYREGFAVREEGATDEVRFGRPGPQEVIHCHSDPARKKVVWGIKDSRNNRGNLYVLPRSMFEKYPRLKSACKLYVIRQYVTDNGTVGLWPAPLPGPREAVSDAAHLEAQENALTRWIRIEWSGNTYTHYLMDEEDGFGDPKFDDRSFEEVITKGLTKWIIRDTQHSLCKHLLRGSPASHVQQYGTE